MRWPINPYRLLDIPAVYRLTQKALAPGGRAHIDALLARLNDPADPRPWLDVGCGPNPLVPTPAGGLFVLDRTPSYVVGLDPSRFRPCVGDATRLPFPPGYFGAVWSIGLLLHLSDTMTQAVLGEMVRVTAPGGHIHILDAVLPEPAWRRPLALGVRRLDRGRFMRRQRPWEALLPTSARWHTERQTYTATGLELLVATGVPQ